MVGTNGDPGGRRSRPGGIALVASLAVHVLAVAILWTSGLAAPSPLPPFKVYKVEIVSPPPQQAGPAEPVVVSPPKVAKPDPAPEPAPPKPEPERVVEAKPKPAPERKAEAKPDPPKTTVVEEKPKEPAPKPTVSTGPKPAPDAKTGGEDLNVKIEGEEFPFPGYLSNIIRQMSRYFRWTGSSNLEARIYFVIHADGSVRDIQIIEPSGSVEFDFQAMGAVELAGRNGAFGALPDGFGKDRLPVEFYFRPAR